MTQPPFLRSLGWYRKGLYAEDSFDKFLAFSNAIEIVAAGYYQTVESIDQARAKKDSKNQIWGCFVALWGSCERWPDTPGDDGWIDANYEIRKNIAHGAIRVDIESVASVVSKLDTIRRAAYRFLRDWRDQFLRADWDVSSSSLLNSDEGALPFE